MSIPLSIHTEPKKDALKIRDLYKELNDLRADLSLMNSAHAFFALKKDVMKVLPRERTQRVMELWDSPDRAMILDGMIHHESMMARQEELMILKMYLAKNSEELWKNASLKADQDWDIDEIIVEARNLNQQWKDIDETKRNIFSKLIKLNRVDLDKEMLIKENRDIITELDPIAMRLTLANARRNLVNTELAPIDLKKMIDFDGVLIEHSLEFGSRRWVEYDTAESNPPSDIYKVFCAVDPGRATKASAKVTEKQMAALNERMILQKMIEAKKDGDLGMGYVDYSDFLDDAGSVQYDAFDAAVIRSLVRKKAKSDMKVLLDAILIAVFFGNNFMERMKKAMDKNAAAIIIQRLTILDLKPKKVDSATLTPSRIASSFAPVVLAFRRVLEESQLLPNTGCSDKTPLLYQDLSLSPMFEIFSSAKVDTDPYLTEMAEKFRQARVKKDPNLKETPEQAVETMKTFRTLAVNGFKKDLVANEILKTGLVFTLEYACEAYGFKAQ